MTQVIEKCGGCLFFDNTDNSNSGSGKTLGTDENGQRRGFCRAPLGLTLGPRTADANCRQPVGVRQPGAYQPSAR